VRIIAYADAGDVYCIDCTPKVWDSYDSCDCDSGDENGVCENNCSGYGPNPIFSTDEQEEPIICGSCQELVDN
jgi:hypothetical protein